jgi:outer membrane protein
VKNFWGILNLALILALAAYVVISRTPDKRGYVLNQRIFDEFKGKKQLEEKLIQIRRGHETTLDSIVKLIEANPKNLALVDHYDSKVQQFRNEYQQLSEKYTADIWKRINGYITDFGKEKNYSFIFGATGEGNLMFADEANNLTDEVIAYINKRYEAE